MNRLSDANSLYLRQHADNPVEWYPWGEEALSRAREENKPILLSIGYSACHWCHVMAHESFEDEDTAKVMNEHFVNIKVDREERPDLDKIYQLSYQALSRRAGGWPLTVFLEPETQVPFFAGTYFPPVSRHGLPAFRDLLTRIAEVYRDQRDQLAEQNASMERFLKEVGRVQAAPDTPGLQPATTAFRALSNQFDEANGGFGSAPKFPHPSNLEFLESAMRVLAGDEADRARDMVKRTLQSMGEGGLFDHLGGGFFRYCVDADWTIPHFEKMLYDNAGLLPLYARWGAGGDAFFEHTARMTVDWLQSTMTAEDGAFYSSLDADSEGEEGRFYVWTREQVKSLLDDSERAVARAAFGLKDAPNFEGRTWHLVRRRPLPGIAEELERSVDEVAEQLETARRKLAQAREERTYPGRDEKVLTSWNALMIRGLVIAGRWLREDGWIDAAERAMEALRRRAWADGRLRAVADSDLQGYLDDYAFCLDATLELLSARWSDEWLDFAVHLADALIEHFEDEEGGGFYFTADDHEELVQRPRSFVDESLPSGNGIAAGALIRLGHLLAESRYLDAADRTLRAAAADLEQAPQACGAMLNALVDWHAPPAQVIVRAGGEPAADVAKAAPGKAVFVVSDASRLAERFRREGDFTAYLCTGTQCSEPYCDPDSLLAELRR